jgi:acyl carrier protein
MKDLRMAVHDAVLEIVQERNPATIRIDDHQELSGDLGLTSLDIATVVANLDMMLEADPFSELFSITSTRTVGDLLNAYEGFFHQGRVPESKDVEEARDRAKRRQEAIEGQAARRRRTSEGG